MLVGVSRTSKTPTCVYLAHRGIKAANIPLVLDLPQLSILERLTRPLIVGLTINPAQLVQIRKSRQRMLGIEEASRPAMAAIMPISTISARSCATPGGCLPGTAGRRSM